MVEDDAQLRQVVAEMLASLGHTVVEVQDGKYASEKLAKAAHQFDLVISDIVMPNGLGGVKLAETIQREYPTIKIVLMSGYADRELPASVSLNCAFIQKPFNLAELQRSIGDLFNDAGQNKSDESRISIPPP